ncbi:MAG TPA: Flp family type IVb pilin [Stellaceae bacterium]|nr:Flp family type IVb pilin [Stellaceae bacterium]
MDTLRTIEKNLFGRRVGQPLAALWRDDSGVTAIEYELIAALIAVAAVTASPDPHA